MATAILGVLAILAGLLSPFFLTRYPWTPSVVTLLCGIGIFAGSQLLERWDARGGDLAALSCVALLVIQALITIPWRPRVGMLIPLAVAAYAFWTGRRIRATRGPVNGRSE